MTISTSASATTVAGTGSATSFGFSFVGDSASDIFVSYIDANGNITLLNPSQYTLVLNAAVTNQLWGIGGVITYPISGQPIAIGTYLSISRVLPLTQQVSIQNQGNSYPRVTEQALDILEMQIQQVSARTGQLRGTWVNNVQYNYGDFVLDGVNGNNTGDYYLCVVANVSSAWSADLAAGDWSLAINVQNIAAQAASAASSYATAASMSATASATSAAASSVSAAASAASATSSAASATQSANSALAAAGTLFGSSTTSNTIGTGSKTFTTQSGLAINPTGGGFLTIASSASPTNYLHGQVTSYSGTTLIINVLDTGGTGTFASWNISPSGPQGTSGTGSGTVNSGNTGQLTYYASNGTVVSGDTNAMVSGGALTMGSSGVQGSVALSGSTSGTTTISPAAAASGTLTVPSATDTIVARATTDTLTNKTINGASNTLTVRLANDVTGNLPVTNLNGGTAASATTYWRGDNSWATPAGIFKTFTSTQQTLTSGGSLTIAHGLVAVPAIIATTIVCLTAEAGYSVGDVLVVSNGSTFGATSTAGCGAAITLDSTNVNIRFTTQTYIYANMLNKGTGANVFLTNANWALVIRAYA